MGFQFILRAESRRNHELPDEFTDRLLAAQEQRAAAGNDPDKQKAAQDAIAAVLTDLKNAEAGFYFDLSSAVMAHYRDIMARLGMTYPTKRPDDPETDPETQSIAEYWAAKDNWPTNVTDDQIAAASAYIDAVRDHEQHHPAGGTTIPSHKLRTREAWDVTGAEVTAALSVYDAADLRPYESAIGDLDQWARWITWLRRAQFDNGFMVC